MPISSIPSPKGSRFDYLDHRTFELRIGPLSIQTPGFTAGDLGIFRFDILLDKLMQRPIDNDGAHELWCAAILSLGTPFPATPIFTTVEDAAGFILSLHKLHDWNKWPEVAEADYDRLGDPIIEALIANHGLPYETAINGALESLKAQKEKP